jgi:hypothetical protein
MFTNKPFRSIAEDIAQARNKEDSDTRDYYRIGVTNEGNTTLTIVGDTGFTSTLTMTPAACRKMIRLLSASLDDTEDD